MKIGIIIGKRKDKWEIVDGCGDVGELREKLNAMVDDGGKVVSGRKTIKYDELRLINANERRAILKNRLI